MVGRVVLFISVVNVFNAGYRGNIWYGGYEEMLQVLVHLFLCFIESFYYTYLTVITAGRVVE